MMSESLVNLMFVLNKKLPTVSNIQEQICCCTISLTCIIYQKSPMSTFRKTDPSTVNITPNKEKGNVFEKFSSESQLYYLLINETNLKSLLLHCFNKITCATVIESTAINTLQKLPLLIIQHSVFSYNILLRWRIQSTKFETIPL